MRLVESAAAGDTGARQELFTCHREAAYRVAFRITGRAEDALDVVQDSFIAAFDKLDRFQREAGFRTWLLRIVTNRALDLLRARKVRLAIPLDTVGDGAAPTPATRASSDAPSASIERRELGERLQRAVESLPAEQRAVFSLYAAGEMTYGEIAEVLGIPIGTVMSRLFHARRRLREQVSDLDSG
jgi:RNA polymerase sigma-70 factor (ECF subfamily)